MLPVVPRIPNQYDDDEQRMRRLEAQERGERRRNLALLVAGVLLLVAFVPCALLGWAGVGLILVPIGLGLAILSALQLILER